MKKIRRIAIGLVLLILIGFIVGKTLNSISSNPGEISYQRECAKCHGKSGEGFGTLIPPLDNSDWLENNLERLPCIIQNGMHEEIEVNGNVYSQQMLGIENLNAVQIANISNYVSKTFTEQQKFFTESEISYLVESCEE